MGERAAPRPIVSILTPTFQHRTYIVDCLEKAIGQTEPRWEQIVVDDGSTDGTGEIVHDYADPRIRYIRQEHRGLEHLAETYNVALRLARGEFVAVLEGDDFWPRDKLEKQLAALRASDAVAVWGAAIVTDAAGTPLRRMPTHDYLARLARPTRAQMVRSLLRGNRVPACTVMCRRDALLAIGGFHQPAGIPTADFATWLELCRVGRFEALDTVLGCYRHHGEQTSVRLKRELAEALGWGVSFVESLSAAERATLDISIAEAQQIEARNRAAADFAAGREALRNGATAPGKRLLRSALRRGDAHTRSKALVGLGCSWLGIDLERVARLSPRA